MAIKSYIVTQPFETPYVRVTGMAHNPQQLKFKKFRKGEIVRGELKHANNEPAFVLLEGVLVAPLNVLKELVTKEIVSGADGSETMKKLQKTVVSPNSKIQYIDATIVGGAIGAGGAYFAEKKGWLPTTDKMNKVYGALIGVVLFGYLLYRYKTNKATKPKTEE